MPGGLVVRGLSGGEKRRLSIACGIVAQPAIIYADEPTSGMHIALAPGSVYTACREDMDITLFLSSVSKISCLHKR